MDQPRLKVLLIEDNPTYAAEVRGWLSSHGHDVEFVLNWVNSVEAAVIRLAQGGLDAILLELPIADADPLETVATIRRRAPTTPILVLTVKKNMALAGQVVSHGADECLIKDVVDGDEYKANFLVRTIKQSVAAYAQRAGHDGLQKRPDRVRVIGVMGATGGAGTTTVACTLAAELRQQTNSRTLLVDLDLNAGMVSYLMGIEPEHSLLDAVGNLDRLDVSLWEKLVTIGPDDVDIISSPSFLGGDELKTDPLHRLLDFLQPVYAWMVLDLGRVNSTALKLLDKMDDLIVVTPVGVCALHQSKRLLVALANAHAGKIHVHVVLNHLLHHSHLFEDELSSIFGVPVYSSLPTDVEALDKSSIERTLPAAASNFRKQVTDLARKLAGLPGAESKSSLANFRRHFGRHPKTLETVSVPQAG